MVGGLGSRDCVGPGGPGGLPGNGGRRPARRLQPPLISHSGPAAPPNSLVLSPPSLAPARACPPTRPSPRVSAGRGRERPASGEGPGRGLQPLPQPGCVRSAMRPGPPSSFPAVGAELGHERLLLSFPLLQRTARARSQPQAGGMSRNWEPRPLRGCRRGPALTPARGASWEGDRGPPSLGLLQDTGTLRGPDSPLLRRRRPGESGGSPARRGGGGIRPAGMGGSDPGWRLQSMAMGSAAPGAEPAGTRGPYRAFCVPLHSGAFHGAQGWTWGRCVSPISPSCPITAEA